MELQNLNHICLRKSIRNPIDAWVWGVGYASMRVSHRMKLHWSYDQWLGATMLNDRGVLTRAFDRLEVLGVLRITRTPTEVHHYKYEFTKCTGDVDFMVDGAVAKYLHDRYPKKAQWLNLLLVLYRMRQYSNMYAGVCRTSSATLADNLGLGLRTVKRAHSILLDERLIQYMGVEDSIQCSIYTIPSITTDGIFIGPVLERSARRPAPKLEVTTADLKTMYALLTGQEISVGR